MVSTNASTKKNHKFYNSTAKAISRGRGDFATKVGSLCVRFLNMSAPVKNQVENGLCKLFDFQGHTIDVSDQAIFTLKYLGLHYELGKKTNVSELLTATYNKSCRFLLFMTTVHLDQADPNCKHSCMIFWACVQLLLGVYGRDDIIDTQTIKISHNLLVHLAALHYGRN